MMLITAEWLKKKIESEPEGSIEIGELKALEKKIHSCELECGADYSHCKCAIDYLRGKDRNEHLCRS